MPKPDTSHRRLLFLLEGGYHLDALGDSVADTFRGVLGLQSLDTFNGYLSSEREEALRRCISEAKAIHSL